MRNWVRGAVIAMAGLAMALPARAETLADALIAAYRNSNLLESNQALLRAADEDVAVAVSALRPVLALRATATAFKDKRLNSGLITQEGLQSSIALSTELMLFDNGRNRLGIDIARESVLATRQDLVSVEQEVLFEAVGAYVDVRLKQEIVGLRNNNVRLITQELRAANDRFEVGEITRTDVAIAEARLAEARSRLAAAEGELAVARERYKLAVGAYPGNLAPLPPSPRIGKSLEEARAVARRTHPAILKQQHLVKVAELQVAAARAEMGPTLRLQGSVDLSATDSVGAFRNETAGGSIGLQLDQTIYGGGRLAAFLRKALAGQEAQRAGLHQTLASVEQSLANAWTGLGVYVASIEASDRQVRAAQTAFDGVKEEATLGARTTLDVLDAEQELLNARALRLEAEAGRYIAVYQILGNMGLLTAEHLNLGIPTYDPAAYYMAVKDGPSHSAQGKALDRILEKVAD